MGSVWLWASLVVIVLAAAWHSIRTTAFHNPWYFLCFLWVCGGLVSFSRHLDVVREIQAALEKGQQDQERRDVLNWLSAPDFDQKHAIAFGMHTTDTGEWFLKHPKFVAWRRGEYNVLWCPGNPGVGKSVMTSVVVHNLQEKDEVVVSIYFDYTTKYTTQQLVEALLFQFMRRSVSGPGMKSIQKYMTGNLHPALEELWTMLETEVGAYARVFIVIDALDEAAGSTWIPLLSRLRELPGVGILATSRDSVNIAAKFREDPRLEIIADEGDLREYVEERLSGSTGRLKQLLEENMLLYAEILTGVVEKAGGTFLLARLHMDALETEPRLIDLRRALTRLPQDLKFAYDATMTRISDKDKSLALRVFSWIIHAARPMTVDDLRYALAVEDGMSTISDTEFLYDQAYLMSICAGLVILRREESRFCEKVYVEFIHHTAQDYLPNHVSTRLPHPVHIAITCLRYLTFKFDCDAPPDPYSEITLMNTVPFLEYAAESFGEHAHTHRNDPTFRHSVMELLHDQRKVSALGALIRNTEGLSAIHLCAHFGLKDYLICLLGEGFDANSKDSNGDTALMIAADRGHEEILQLLLAREDIDVNSKGQSGITALIRGAISGHQGIVELLLARNDVDVNRCDDWGTALARAASRGHSGITELLLARGDVNINLQDMDGRTPLAMAIYQKHEAVVRLLLARDDLNISLTDHDGDTHLHLAAAYDNGGRIAELLLAKGGIDINSKNARGRVALASAVLNANDVVVKILLTQATINVNAREWYSETPLDWAENEAGWEENKERKITRKGIIKLLREAGARRDARLGPGWGSWGL